MFATVNGWLKTFEGWLDQRFGHDISTPRAKRRALWHFYWVDHGILRTFWTNMDEISPGVWRSNQPSPARIRRYKKMGIKTILNLRGRSRRSYFVFESRECKAQDIRMISIGLNARKLAERKTLLRLLDMFGKIEKPFVMHCKSGADRAGLASALYLMHTQGMSVQEAKNQLSLRYLHLRSFQTGVLDFFLDAYQADTVDNPLPVREWIETRYDREALTSAWEQSRSQG